MAASIKISELNSLNNLTDVDLFLVSDMETGTSRKISYTDLKSNVTASTASALSNLTNVVAQNRTDAETLVETIRVALQASIDNNTTTFGIADNELATRLQVLEADPTTQAALEVVAGDVTQNATNIAALQTSIDNLDIDIAPETLNSISELSAALGDDPQIIINLQSQLNDYIAHIEARNLEAGLAEGILYADTIYGG